MFSPLIPPSPHLAMAGKAYKQRRNVPYIYDQKPQQPRHIHTRIVHFLASIALIC